jgi:hypothetical protein
MEKAGTCFTCTDLRELIEASGLEVLKIVEICEGGSAPSDFMHT